MAMIGKMVQDEVRGEPDQVDHRRAFGFYCLSLINFKWGGKQHVPIHGFKSFSGYYVDMDCTRMRKEPMKCGNDI